MTLRRRTALIISALLIVLTLVLYVVARTILLTSYAELERRDMVRNTQRMDDAVANELAALETKIHDWSAWDDAYKFVADDNQEFIDANLGDTALSNLKLNLMMFVQPDGRVVFGAGADLEAGTQASYPPSIESHLKADGVLMSPVRTQGSISGTLLLPEGVMLIVAQPILDSNRQGPPHGVLVAGKFLNDAEIKRLGGITHQSITLTRLDASSLPSDLATAQAHLSDSSATFVQTLDANTIAGYARLDDVYGHPAALLRAEADREIARQGDFTLRSLLLCVAVSGLLTVLAVLLLMERLVLRRVIPLTRIAAQLADGQVDVEVPQATGRDEICGLARSFASIVGYLREAAVAARALAAGDLTQEIAARSNQDALGLAFCDMTSSLRGLISDVRDTAVEADRTSRGLAVSAAQAGDATLQISRTIQEVANSSASQASNAAEANLAADRLADEVGTIAEQAQTLDQAVGEASGAVERLRATLVEVSAALSVSTSSAGQVSERAATGEQRMRRVIHDIEHIRDVTASVVGEVREAGRRATEIGNIVSTIQDIADQTNLLALNAAIEAARAGEQGRGFAVVADEVRRLAAKASEAAGEVVELVNGVQSSIGGAIAVTERGAESVAQGVAGATEAGAALQQIMAAAVENSRAASNTASAAEQIRLLTGAVKGALDTAATVGAHSLAATTSMTGEINSLVQGVASVAAAAEQNAASVEEVSATSEQLTAQANEVARLAQELSAIAGTLRRDLDRFTLAADEHSTDAALRSPLPVATEKRVVTR